MGDYKRNAQLDLYTQVVQKGVAFRQIKVAATKGFLEGTPLLACGSYCPYSYW